MAAVVSPLPDDVEALKALLTAALERANEAEARAANAVARESAIEAVIAHLKLQIAKLRREQYDASAERTMRCEPNVVQGRRVSSGLPAWRETSQRLEGKLTGERNLHQPTGTAWKTCSTGMRAREVTSAKTSSGAREGSSGAMFRGMGVGDLADCIDVRNSRRRHVLHAFQTTWKLGISGFWRS